MTKHDVQFDHLSLAWILLIKLSILSIKPLTSLSFLEQQGSLNKTFSLRPNNHSGIISCSSSLLFLKSLITDLTKPMGYPTSKYFCVIVWTSASKSEAILKTRCKSPRILFSLYLFGIWEIQNFGSFPGLRNTLVITEPCRFLLKAVSRKLVGLVVKSI